MYARSANPKRTSERISSCSSSLYTIRPSLVAFLCGLHLRLSKPQWQHVLRLADALVVSEARHKTIASLYRLIVDAPDPSNGADTLRISPWTAEDLRAPMRHFIVADLVAYAHRVTSGPSMSVSMTRWAKKTRARGISKPSNIIMTTPRVKATRNPLYTNGAVHVEVRLELGARSYAYDWRLYLREKTVRRLNRQRAPSSGCAFARKRRLAHDMLAGLQQLLPPGFQVYVLFDSWYASNRLLKFCRRQGWHVVCAIKSNRKLDDKKLSQWPQALRHQRYQRVQLTATDQRQRTYLVRTRQGKLNSLPFEVCVLISQRHHRDKHPKYFLCTDLSLSAQQILSIYQKRWPIEVDNFYVKQHLGLADFRVQSYEATEKWFAVVFLALAFLQWRLNHARAQGTNGILLPMWCVNTAMNMHGLCLETACQEAAKLSDYLPVLKRFLCQPT